MYRFAVACFSAFFLSSALAAPLATVTIDGKTEWTDTGVNLMPGTNYVVTASGFIDYGNNQLYGPNGSVETGSQQTTSNDVTFSLIGRISPSGDAFFVGGLSVIRDFTVGSGGTLFLGFNDDVFRDNVGEFVVTIWEYDTYLAEKGFPPEIRDVTYDSSTGTLSIPSVMVDGQQRYGVTLRQGEGWNFQLESAAPQ